MVLKVEYLIVRRQVRLYFYKYIQYIITIHWKTHWLLDTVSGIQELSFCNIYRRNH